MRKPRLSPLILGLMFLLGQFSFAQGSAAILGYPELKALLEAPGSKVLVLDVRTAEEFASGHIPGALLAPYDSLASSFREADKDRPIVVYCRSGRRSAIAKATLEGMGYRRVRDFGAFESWKGPVATGAR